MADLEFTLRKQYPAAGTSGGFTLNVSLECLSGITVLFGASGSGKTMTLDALAGFLRPDVGRIVLNDGILFDGGSGACLPPQRRAVGYVFQNYALFPNMTVEQNLAFGIQHLPPLERTRKIREMLDRFGLAERAKSRPAGLSGGEKQRASIARALIPEPRLLLLDEPVRGLDHPLREDFYEILHSVRERHRIPILLVTHDATEGFLLGDQMAVFGAGEIVQVGTPEQVFRHPRNPEVARLLGISNIFEGVVEQLDPMANHSLLRTPRFSVNLAYLPGRLRGDTVKICIPREQVSLVPAGHGSSAGPHDNRIPVHILEEVFTPATVRMKLQVSAVDPHAPKTPNTSTDTQDTPLIEVEVSRRSHRKMKLDQQKDWLAELPLDSIHVFDA